MSSRAGYTLAEMLVSMVIMSVLMAGLASALLIAGNALPNENNPLNKVLSAAEAVGQLADELAGALHITENGPTAVACTVPDRNGDGLPERLRYAWTGSPANPGPLTRQYNGGPAVQILTGVNLFNLGYDLKTVVEEYPGLIYEDNEQLLCSYSGSSNLKDYVISNDKWIGQYFQPAVAALPADAVSWRATRVGFWAKREGSADSSTLVQLRNADNDQKPTSTVLEEIQMAESSLSNTYTWKEFSFANMSGLAPGLGACLVLKHSGTGGDSSNIRYDRAGGSGRLTTNNWGFSWTYNDDQSMQYKVYGRVSRPGPSRYTPHLFVTAIRITAQVGGDAESCVRTAGYPLNAPELLAAAWETNFDVNPTSLDANGDGLGDWRVHGGGAFNPVSLANGVWQANCTLDTNPNHDFAKRTIAEVCFRNTSVGGNGAVFSINADWAGSLFAPLLAYLQLQSDGTQTLSVYHKLNHSTPVQLVSVGGLPGYFITLRLLIEPDLNMVNVKVNGLDKGTYTYNCITPPHNDRFASIFPSVSSAEFDYVSIRVAR